MSPQLLIVGLGNLPLPMTRHSIGNLIIDALAARLGMHLAPDRNLGGLTGHAHIPFGDASLSLTLVKPKPLMNISGPSVASALRNTVKAPDAMIVIHDSLSHKPQTLSVKFGGSANGHNGVRSIVSALSGEMGFHRFRIGIGRDGTDAAEYVLGKLSPEERNFWGKGGAGADLVWREIERIASKLPS